jgi:hypothetical protein
LLQVAVGEGVGKRRGTEGTDPLVEQVELAVEPCGDQLVLGLAAPPSARLRSGIGHKVLPLF